MKCDSRASLLANTFASPCLGRKPKARVVASMHTNVCQVYKYEVYPKALHAILLSLLSDKVSIISIYGGGAFSFALVS